MKRISLISTSFVVFICLSACKKSESTIISQSPVIESLSIDTSFNKLINNEIELRNRLESICLEKNLNSDELNSKIKSIIEKSDNLIELKNNLNKNFDSDFYEFLVNFKSQYSQNWDNLNKKYSSINEVEIKEATIQYFNRRSLLLYENKTKSNSIKANMKNQCSWGYDLCIAGATSAAILCHVGCVGSTAGFGTPACVLLCGTIQVAAGAQCMSSFCNFKN